MFTISLLNPLRFIDTTNVNSGFDGNFATDLLLSYQTHKCYFQPWQLSDILKLQILSDYIPTNLLLKSARTGNVIATAFWAPIDTTVIGQTFKVYELSFTFTGLSVGKYYAEFSYTDLTENHILRSEYFDVSVLQPNTMLLKYKNSSNDFNVIFNTGIEFQFRVECAIKDFIPKNIRNVYNDQRVNSTLLSSNPYRDFKFYIGFNTGVPPWVVDKINQIQSVDQVSYDGTYYQVITGAEFTNIYEDGIGMMGSSIEVQQTENNFNKYTTGPTGKEFTPMQKIIPYYGVSANLIISGKFKAYTDLEKICINKRSSPQTTLLVGTTLGGSEIGTFVVDDAENVFTIEWLFSGTTTMYLTGLAGQDTDVFIVYKQLDEPPVILGTGSGTPTISTMPKGSAWVYHEITAGDLQLHFNTTTGLGRTNTPYAGCAFADGRNGTPDWRRRSIIMMDESMPAYDSTQLGQPIGTDSLFLTKDQLPAAPVTIPVSSSQSDSWRTGSGSGQPVVNVGGAGSGAANPAQNGNTNNLGIGAAIPLIPRASIEIWIIKLTD